MDLLRVKRSQSFRSFGSSRSTVGIGSRTLSTLIDFFYQGFPEGRPENLNKEQLTRAVRVLKMGNRILKAENSIMESRLEKLGMIVARPELKVSPLRAMYQLALPSSPPSREGGSGSAYSRVHRSSSRTSLQTKPSLGFIQSKKYALNLQEKVSLAELTLERAQKEYREFITATSKTLDVLRVKADCKAKALNDAKRSLEDLAKWYEKTKLSRTLTGEKLIGHMNSLINQWHHIGQTFSRKSGSLRVKLRHLQQEIKESTRVGNTLVPSDLDYLKAENVRLKKQLDASNQSYFELKSTVGQLTAKVTHSRVRMSEKSSTLNNFALARESKEKELESMNQQFNETLAELDKLENTSTKLCNKVHTFNAPSVPAYIQLKARLETRRQKYR